MSPSGGETALSPYFIRVCIFGAILQQLISNNYMIYFVRDEAGKVVKMKPCSMVDEADIVKLIYEYKHFQRKIKDRKTLNIQEQNRLQEVRMLLKDCLEEQEHLY